MKISKPAGDAMIAPPQLAKESPVRSNTEERAPVQSTDTTAASDLYRLKRAPVWMVNTKVFIAPPLTGKLRNRNHGFVAVGDPGRKNKSGTAYYGISGDEKRGSVEIDKKFISNTKRKVGIIFKNRSFKFQEGVRSAIDLLQGKSYPSKEAFYLAYSEARKKIDANISDEQIHEEIKKLYFLVPTTKMELQARTPNIGTAPNASKDAKPNLAERDCQRFEQMAGTEKKLGKPFTELTEAEKASDKVLVFKDTSLRRLPTVDPLSLLEAKRSHLLQRLYVDEMHGRDGTGIPVTDQEKTVDPSVLKRVAESTPTYKKLPLFSGELAGNCNAGVASLLQTAIDNDPNGTPQRKLKPASAVAFGFHHKIKTWDPIKKQSNEPLNKPDPSSSTVESRSIRTAEINVAELRRVLQKQSVMQKTAAIEAKAAATAKTTAEEK